MRRGQCALYPPSGGVLPRRYGASTLPFYLFSTRCVDNRAPQGPTIVSPHPPASLSLSSAVFHNPGRRAQVVRTEGGIALCYICRSRTLLSPRLIPLSHVPANAKTDVSCTSDSDAKRSGLVREHPHSSSHPSSASMACESADWFQPLSAWLPRPLTEIC